MKTLKRIIAVVLLCLVLFAVGYLVFTGNRLTVPEVQESVYET